MDYQKNNPSVRLHHAPGISYPILSYFTFQVAKATSVQAGEMMSQRSNQRTSKLPQILMMFKQSHKSWPLIYQTKLQFKTQLVTRLEINNSLLVSGTRKKKRRTCTPLLSCIKLLAVKAISLLEMIAPMIDSKLAANMLIKMLTKVLDSKNNSNHLCNRVCSKTSNNNQLSSHQSEFTIHQVAEAKFNSERPEM